MGRDKWSIMLKHIKTLCKGVSTGWGWAKSKPFTTVFIICGAVIFAMLTIYGVEYLITKNQFVAHAWHRTLLHLGFGGIIARSVFFGLTQLDNKIRYNFNYKQYYGIPILVVFIIALCQEFFPGSGDFFRTDIGWNEKYKSLLDIAAWPLSATFAIWSLYRNCENAYKAKLDYLSRRKKLRGE